MLQVHKATTQMMNTACPQCLETYDPMNSASLFVSIDSSRGEDLHGDSGVEDAPFVLYAPCAPTSTPQCSEIETLSSSNRALLLQPRPQKVSPILHLDFPHPYDGHQEDFDEELEMLHHEEEPYLLFGNPRTPQRTPQQSQHTDMRIRLHMKSVDGRMNIFEHDKTAFSPTIERNDHISSSSSHIFDCAAHDESSSFLFSPYSCGQRELSTPHQENQVDVSSFHLSDLSRLRRQIDFFPDSVPTSNARRQFPHLVDFTE